MRDQLSEAHRLAPNRQRAQRSLLHGGEPGDLLGEQLADTAKDHHAPFEKQADLASEEVCDGLCHDLQGQRVARVRLDEARPLLRGPHELLVREQLLAGASTNDCGESTCRQSESHTSKAGASRKERKSTTSKRSATWCMSVTASVDLPMPPMPSTLTTRQCSCTTHCSKVVISSFRP